jgi:hypothetical protein
MVLCIWLSYWHCFATNFIFSNFCLFIILIYTLVKINFAKTPLIWSLCSFGQLYCPQNTVGTTPSDNCTFTSKLTWCVPLTKSVPINLNHKLVSGNDAAVDQLTIMSLVLHFFTAFSNAYSSEVSVNICILHIDFFDLSTMIFF